MRKDVLSNKIAKLRIKHLLQQGYTYAELARKIELSPKTIANIVDPNKELIRLETHEKVQEFCDYLDSLTVQDSYFFTDEDVIDREDAEQGAKEVAQWLYIILAIVSVILIAGIFLVRYIIN
jgi:transcriptional regulator with XRE-family HTH domain